MEKRNRVYIGCSLDGYISDKEGKLDWLNQIPIPEGLDMGYGAFMENTDALVMGRNTFDTVCAFDVEWPYKKPVFVLSNTLTQIPKEYKDKVFLEKGPLEKVLSRINDQGFHSLYIDGGKTIQSFLKEDLIDEIIITTIPVLLGGGSPLFSKLDSPLEFECIDSKLFLDKIGQSHFRRKRKDL